VIRPYFGRPEGRTKKGLSDQSKAEQSEESPWIALRVPANQERTEQ
jgi:hypothetical protein